MNNYQSVIKLTEEQHERLQAYLVDPQSQEEALEEGDNFTVTAKFSNGYEMDIYIYPVAYDENNYDNIPWSEATLYDTEGNPVANSQAEESDIIGEWVLEDKNGNRYRVDVIDYDKSRDKASPKKDSNEIDR